MRAISTGLQTGSSYHTTKSHCDVYVTIKEDYVAQSYNFTPPAAVRHICIAIKWQNHTARILYAPRVLKS